MRVAPASSVSSFRTNSHTQHTHIHTYTYTTKPSHCKNTRTPTTITPFHSRNNRNIRSSGGITSSTATSSFSSSIVSSSAHARGNGLHYSSHHTARHFSICTSKFIKENVNKNGMGSSKMIVRSTSNFLKNLSHSSNNRDTRAVLIITNHNNHKRGQHKHHYYYSHHTSYSTTSSLPPNDNTNTITSTTTPSRVASTASDNTNEEVQVAFIKNPNFAIGIWLLVISGMVYAMIMIGGITRLTESGLSITEWKPVTGAVPPMSEEEWLIEFEKYKNTPEFIRLRADMGLGEFKFIYMMEYSHRLLGRVIGLAFALPALYFWKTGAVKKGKLGGRLSALFVLGGLQGALGWFMVKSGLVDQRISSRTASENEQVTLNDVPRVSQYRLVAHLISAIGLYSVLLWTGVSCVSKIPITNTTDTNQLTQTQATIKKMSGSIGAVAGARRLTMGLVHLAGLTILSGGFVAGLDAGLVYNEWPFMGGFPHLIPEDIARLRPLLRNLTEDPVTVQFVHRMLAYTTFAWAVGTHVSLIKKLKKDKGVQGMNRLMITSAMMQVVLGITTLLTFVPVPIASLHQGNSILLLSSSLLLLQSLQRRSHILKQIGNNKITNLSSSGRGSSSLPIQSPTTETVLSK